MRICNHEKLIALYPRCLGVKLWKNLCGFQDKTCFKGSVLKLDLTQEVAPGYIAMPYMLVHNVIYTTFAHTQTYLPANTFWDLGRIRKMRNLFSLFQRRWQWHCIEIILSHLCATSALTYGIGGVGSFHTGFPDLKRKHTLKHPRIASVLVFFFFLLISHTVRDKIGQHRESVGCGPRDHLGVNMWMLSLKRVSTGF